MRCEGNCTVERTGDPQGVGPLALRNKEIQKSVSVRECRREDNVNVLKPRDSKEGECSSATHVFRGGTVHFVFNVIEFSNFQFYLNLYGLWFCI